MDKFRMALLRFLYRYGKSSAQFPSHHGNSEIRVPKSIRKLQ